MSNMQNFVFRGHENLDIICIRKTLAYPNLAAVVVYKFLKKNLGHATYELEISNK